MIKRPFFVFYTLVPVYLLSPMFFVLFLFFLGPSGLFVKVWTLFGVWTEFSEQLNYMKGPGQSQAFGCFSFVGF